MLERTERISLRISFVLSKVEPGAGASHRLQLKLLRHMKKFLVGTVPVWASV